MRTGRIGIVRSAIVAAFGGKPKAKVAEVAAGVSKALVADKEFKGYGGSRATVLGDCRRALASLQRERHAAFVGVKAQGSWKVYARPQRGEK